METSNDKELTEIGAELMVLSAKMNEAEESFNHMLVNIHPGQKASAINLIDYLALRDVDIRNLQDKLHIHGLSSLTSSESHVRWQINAVLNRIGIIPPPSTYEIPNYFVSMAKVRQHTSTLFGDKMNNDIPFIMVTFDTELGKNVSVLEHYLRSGMNIARINCAYDNETIWEAMIGKIKKAVENTGIPCKVYMDLAGPKLRTVLKGKKGKKHKLKLEHRDHFILADIEEESENERTVYCSSTGIVEQLHEGASVLFDDGEVEAVVEKMKGRKAVLRIVRTSGKKPEIKDGKGINFPGTRLAIDSLTDFDLSCLPFIVKHADMVGYSFVREATDVHVLQQALKSLSEKPIHIILKIETIDAVNNLPSLLLQGMKEAALGVMIARGDLAVEIGIERLSEIQDEIL